MKFNVRVLILVGLVGLIVLIAILPATAQMVEVPVTTSGVLPMPEIDEFIDNASSTLVRYNHAVAMTMYATELTPGDVVTAWWVVWNHPEFCSPPGCTPEDLPMNGGDARIEASMLYADGQVVNEDGTAIYTGYLMEGDTTGEAIFEAAGMDNAQTAEVHFVLRSHGPAIEDILDEQLTSFGAACKGAPPNTGTPGDNDCANIQGSGHMPDGSVWDPRPMEG